MWEQGWMLLVDPMVRGISCPWPRCWRMGRTGGRGIFGWKAKMVGEQAMAVAGEDSPLS